MLCRATAPRALDAFYRQRYVVGMGKMIDDTTAKQNIAANVRRLLESRGWPQSRLASATGEQEMQISRIVRGCSVPNAVALARIAEAFDVSIDRLLAAPPESHLEKTT